MIYNMPKEYENLILDYIFLSILQTKFNKELENDYNSRTEILLQRITDDLQQIKQEMKQANIKVFPPTPTRHDDFVDYYYTWNNVEDYQRFWKAGLKMHVKKKLAKYI